MILSEMVEAKAKLDPENFSLANCIRVLSIDAVEAANSGHPGAPMGMADAATVLFRKHLKFDASRTGRIGTVSCYPMATPPCCYIACYI